MGDFLQKLRQNRIDERYSLIRKIGEGGCGAVYLGFDHANDRDVALKLEHRDAGEALREEISCLESFSGLLGFPELYWSGQKDDYTVMAFELLGPSLEDLFAYCGRKFSLKTTLMIADHLLARLKAVHSAQLVHRDVKPSNFLMGMGEKGSVIYATDFGIAMHYDTRLRDDIDDSATGHRRVVGTIRFASIGAHKGQAQWPKDDLEALGYMLIYFLNGRLPWQGLNATDADEKDRLVMEMKENLSVDELCLGLPAEIASYIKAVRSLPKRQRPPYSKFKKMFRGVALREGFVDDNVFDWTVRMYQEQASSGA